MVSGLVELNMVGSDVGEHFQIITPRMAKKHLTRKFNCSLMHMCRPRKFYTELFLKGCHAPKTPVDF